MKTRNSATLDLTQNVVAGFYVDASGSRLICLSAIKRLFGYAPERARFVFSNSPLPSAIRIHTPTAWGTRLISVRGVRKAEEILMYELELALARRGVDVYKDMWVQLYDITPKVYDITPKETR